MVPLNQTRHSRRPARALRQRGAVILMVCFLLFFLLGFVAIAFDFGRLFIVKTELQTAMDSCALAAAQELDGQWRAAPAPPPPT
jgi:Flp pilus assembly protein TadG